MKIAIVHDWLVTNAGAEKVLKAVIEIYPAADIFSLVDFLDTEDRQDVLSGKTTNRSFIQKMPFSKKLFRNYLPLFPKAIESLDLSSYDLIISSSWAVAKGIKKTDKQLHICYCHTPIRYAWDLQEEYTANLKGLKKFLVKRSLEYIKKWDIKTSISVDFYIANSNFVANRIKKTYNRDSIVIYPPVDTSSFKFCSKKEEFYLSASRLVPYKKTKLIVEAFNKMPNKKLVVIGEGEEYKEIKKIAQANVSVLGYQEKSVMIDYMQKAKAFVYAAVEDFGIVPIEAMSCGTPVIALNEGGTKETVIDGKNGIHFENQTTEDIIKAVEKIENTVFDYSSIRESSLKYNNFKIQFQNFIQQKINTI